MVHRRRTCCWCQDRPRGLMGGAPSLKRHRLEHRTNQGPAAGKAQSQRFAECFSATNWLLSRQRRFGCAGGCSKILRIKVSIMPPYTYHSLRLMPGNRSLCLDGVRDVLDSQQPAGAAEGDEHHIDAGRWWLVVEAREVGSGGVQHAA